MDEIEMMKAAFDSVSDALETSLNLNKAYLAKIAELEKDGKVCATCGGLVYDAVLPQKQSEPVAWLHPELDGAVEFDWHFACATQGKKEKIPLYTTPPTCQLSDEAINELWLITCSKAGEVDDMQLHFARAIEAKVRGEK
jgi:hypothetical protein